MTQQNFVTLHREVVAQMTQALDLGYALLESAKSIHAPTLLACYHLGRAALTEQVQPCIGKDPLCPCQDGDACHYKNAGDTKALPIKPEQVQPSNICKKHSCLWAGDGCPHCKDEQVQPAQGEPDVCCTQYETCLKPCTPRGRELGLKEAALMQSLRDVLEQAARIAFNANCPDGDDYAHGYNKAAKYIERAIRAMIGEIK